jgi:hypothetical protein
MSGALWRASKSGKFIVRLQKLAHFSARLTDTQGSEVRRVRAASVFPVATTEEGVSDNCQTCGV